MTMQFATVGKMEKFKSANGQIQKLPIRYSGLLKSDISAKLVCS